MPHHAVPFPQLAESSSARAALEARLADAESRLASSLSASDAAASRAASATAALDAEKFATRETMRKLQTTVTEKATLKAEIASLEEQLMAYANAPTPGPLDHLAGFAGSVAAVVKEVAPGVLDEGLALVKSASVSVAATVAPVVPAVTKALATAGTTGAAAADATRAAAARLRKQAGPAASRVAHGARAAAAAAAPTLAEAAARASAVRDALQRVIVERVSKMEAFSSLNVDEHRLEHVAWLFASGVVASPMVFVCVRVALVFAAVAFGKRRRAVPRRVAEDSVPLRTPTPEKKTAPFGARTRARGRTIRSPEGEVLRFA